MANVLADLLRLRKYYEDQAQQPFDESSVLPQQMQGFTSVAPNQQAIIAAQRAQIAQMEGPSTTSGAGIYGVDSTSKPGQSNQALVGLGQRSGDIAGQMLKSGQEQLMRQAELANTGGTGVRPPQGYRWTQDGNLEAIPGGNADPTVLAQLEGIKTAFKPKEAKPLTEVQGNAVGFGMRANEADKIINDLADKGVLTGSLIKQGIESVPLVGGALGAAANALVASPQQQQVEQAQRDFVNAILRKESGASISPAEFDNARKQYFAQPGDSPEVLAQKGANRDTAIRALRIQAGPGGENIPVREQAAPEKHNSLPDPRQYNGKIAKDTETGTRWMSNGRDWVRAP